MSMDIVKIAEEYARASHAKCNHLYDKTKPYAFHLQMVYHMGKMFIHLVNEKDKPNVLAACWTHDIIEDARETYNDVKHHTNETVAELTYALTNEKGRTRKDRANNKYFEGIRIVPNATFIKLCDRIANSMYSKSSRSSMYKKYQQEHNKFINALNVGGLQSMVMYLDEILNPQPKLK